MYGHPARRILPRFGPGIHGFWLDPHYENEAQPGQSFFAELRGFLPTSSNALHEQAIRPSVDTQNLAYSQETVERLSEQAYEQTARRDIMDIGEDSQANRLFPLEYPLRFRRYVQPLQPAPGRSENISDQDFWIDRLLDVVDAEESKEPSSGSGNGGEVSNVGSYECNVCLDMAVEPVLTSCGHLFCWPCLYQWLYVHSEDEECPVCKGAVTERDIIPIYGRGNATIPARPSPLEGADFVPPRPHARRTESVRQRLGRWERPSEEAGENLWRFIEAMRIRAFHFPQERIEGAHDLRARTRRRTSEREHIRAPTVESLYSLPAAEANHAFLTLNQAVENIPEALHRRVSFLSDQQEDLMRRLALNRSEIEERLAVIRSRLTNLSRRDVNPRRTISAAISVSGILIPSIAATNSTSQYVQEAVGLSMQGETAPAQMVENNRQGYQEMSDVSGRHGRQRIGVTMTERNDAPDHYPSEYVDMDVESSHGRKRRRLN
ncbi:hypothetical protein O6H91_07G032300 [Diphasiastrum complanatum]|uniref:Uncharacterized protein n=2 Tax=Diphasiastrum complanatum TaxID=34168 RepID=A0ACC2D416_DIPCM|nr:hypothetical protein O6H91_07G032300 [Diphasiastrum complanatum]